MDTPHDVHLGHRRDQSAVHAAVAFDEVVGEERAGAQLRDPERHVADGGGQAPLAHAWKAPERPAPTEEEVRAAREAARRIIGSAIDPKGDEG